MWLVTLLLENADCKSNFWMKTLQDNRNGINVVISEELSNHTG